MRVVTLQYRLPGEVRCGKISAKVNYRFEKTQSELDVCEL